MTKKTTLLSVLLVTSVLLLQAQWIQIGADIDGEATYDWSGVLISLSSDGSIVAIGAPSNDGNGANSGHVRVFQNQSGTWNQIGYDINGEAAGDHSGISVSLNSDGLIVAIGTPYNRGNGVSSGHVRVFQNQSGTWNQIGDDIDGVEAFEFFGRTVSLNSDGSIIAIGARKDNATDTGHVRIFKYIGENWVQIGADIYGEAVGDRFGTAISLSADGSIVAIGGPFNNGNGLNSGHVRIFQNQSDVWIQIGADIVGESDFDISGKSVCLSSDGSIVAIGSPNNEDNGIESGHVRVFQNQSGTWTQIGTDIVGESEYDQSGWSLSLNSDGTIVAIGAPNNEGNGLESGHVRVYKNINDTWTQVGADIDGEAENDKSSWSISLSSENNVIAIGAYKNDGNGIDAGHVRVYNNPTLSVVTIVDADFSVYPNPTDGVLFIKEDTVEKVEVMDILGRIIYKANQTNKVDLSEKEKGTYFMRIYTDRGVGFRKVMLK